MKSNDFTSPCLRVLILCVLFFILSDSTYAQIKVKTDGKVGIGILNPDAQLQIHGTLTKFSFPTGTYSPTPLLIDSYYSNSRFYPYAEDKGYLG